MSRNLKSIKAFITVLFLVCGLISVTAAAKEIFFHCSLGMDGRVMAEAELQLSKDGSELKYRLVVRQAEDITMAHLHFGKPGGINSPVVWLYPPSPPPKLIPGLFEGLLAQGIVTDADLMGPMRGEPLSRLIAEIKAGNVYVNIHTRKHPRGDICGPVYLVEK